MGVVVDGVKFCSKSFETKNWKLRWKDIVARWLS